MSEKSIIETNDERFETDVIVRSQLGLVVVDFWAQWCAPCRQLAPVLEKLAVEYEGRLTLVKANTEENEAASRRFGVSGIPAVFAVLNEEVVDGFQGALPESAVREWIDRCLIGSQLEEIQQLMSSDPEAAESQLIALREAGTESDKAAGLLVELYHQQGQAEKCRALIDELSARGFLESNCEKIRAELDLQSDSTGVDLETLKSQVESTPDDNELKLTLARGLAAKQRYQEACNVCLELVERDRQATGEQARVLMIDIFRIAGDEAELTRDYRRKLSMLLY